MPPPANVLEDPLVRLIVPVPVTVRFDPLTFHPPVPESVQVPELIASVLVALPWLATPPDAPEIVTLYPFALKVPDIWLNAEDDPKLVFSASCSVTVPPGLSVVILCVNVLPALVIV